MQLVVSSGGVVVFLFQYSSLYPPFFFHFEITSNPNLNPISIHFIHLLGQIVQPWLALRKQDLRRRLQAPAASSLHRSRSSEKTVGTKNWLAFIAYRLLHGRYKLQHLAQKKWNNARRCLILWIRMKVFLKQKFEVQGIKQSVGHKDADRGNGLRALIFSDAGIT